MARCHAQAVEVEARDVLAGAGDAAGEGTLAVLGGGVDGEDAVADADDQQALADMFQTKATSIVIPSM